MYAAGCRTPGDGCLLLGSTLIVYGVTATAVEVAGLELQAYPGDGFLLGGSTSSGGNVVEWARRTFGADVAAEPFAGGLRVLPYLAGERTPVRDPSATGAVLGITLATTPAELHRGFIDGIALAALDHADRIATALRVDRWRVSGGGVRNPAWLQATADALGTPLELAPLAGEGAGPALFALAAMGIDLPAPGSGRIDPEPSAARRYRDALAPYRARHPHLEVHHDRRHRHRRVERHRPRVRRTPLDPARRARHIPVRLGRHVRRRSGDRGGVRRRRRRGPPARAGERAGLLRRHRLVHGAPDLGAARRALAAELRHPPGRAVST